MTAVQADGLSGLSVVGECCEILERGPVKMTFEAIVVEGLSVPALGGMNFIYDNNIIPRAREELIEVNKHMFPQTNPLAIEKAMQINIRQISQTEPLTAFDKSSGTVHPSVAAETGPVNPHWNGTDGTVVVGSADSLGSTAGPLPAPQIIRISKPQVILPDECLTTPVPSVLFDHSHVMVEPRHKNLTNFPQPQICCIKNGSINISNDSEVPILLKKNNEFAQIRSVQCKPPLNTDFTNEVENLHTILKEKDNVEERLSQIKVDPHNQLTKEQKEKVWAVIKRHSEVFDGDLTGGYNNASGPCYANYNFSEEGPPMPNKGYFPNYSHKEQLQIQALADHLLDQGVMADPSKLGISVRHTSPLLLVIKPKAQDKPSGERTIKDLRLVAAFNQLNKHIQSIPSMRKQPEHTFQIAAQFKYIIVTDASDYFYQQWLHKEKWPYMGVQTPFKGKYIMTRATQGTKGMSEESDELVAKCFYDMIVSQKISQQHDDLLTGGSDFDAALTNFEWMLNIAKRNNLKLAPHKTICFPKKVQINGWEWEEGQIKPSSHQMNTLKNITQESITTVKNLRSYIGLYKVFFKSHPNQASILDPLEKECAGKNTKDKITWTSELKIAFQSSKSDIVNIRPRTIPLPTDLLVITKDAASSTKGIGMMLWAVRNKQWLLAECYSFKINSNLSGWHICELEGYADATAAKKFKPYILESKQDTVILTDNRP